MSKRRKTKVGEQVNLSSSCSVFKASSSKTKIPRKFYDSHRDMKRVLEDVLIKVRSFIILVDFVVLDFEEDRERSILLGRPFLATSRSTIDLEKNKLTMKINGEIEIFKCDHQLNEEDGRRKLGEQCKQFKERDKRAEVEWHDER
ncbi:hypothetical protein EPI10_005802 [Gossypium australe]|uniref:Retrovirus-related Pol polyprotein from transposon opus n=1 Tax=Gossypium australe TaxID=47621 RepID=A0A5B6WS18_9ROSI|nr:hypothetical protein EPI10_005802 [Gossypium australe]